MNATGLTSGTVYPALDRLESAGCLKSTWEDASAAHAEGRPARRLFHAHRLGRDDAPRCAGEVQGAPPVPGLAPEQA
jgi:DNA-binding PadR family transcriptional regulator